MQKEHKSRIPNSFGGGGGREQGALLIEECLIFKIESSRMLKH